MSDWEKVKIGKFLIKENQRFSDLENKKEFEVFGVSNIKGITKTSHKKSSDLSKYIIIKPNFFAYNPYRINVGSIGLTSKNTQGLVSPAYVVFRTNEKKLLPNILLTFLKSKEGLFQIKKNARGTVRQALRYEDLCKIEMKIPPIEDQKKIVKKIISIKGQKQKLDEKTLSQKFTLKKLRQQILQDAISGKLTADWRAENPDTEPASELLKKIKAEKEKLIAEKKIKKEKPLPPVLEDEIPFALPEGFLWIRIDDVFFIEKGNTGIKNAIPGDYPLIVTAKNRLTNKTYQFDSESIIIPMVSSTGHGHASLNRIHFQKGKFAVGSILSVLTAIDTKKISAEFYYNFLNHFKDELIVKKMSGAANVSLTRGALRSIVIPVLPINIQLKAVKLFKYIDKLEEKITQNEKNAEMLMQAFLGEVFRK